MEVTYDSWSSVEDTDIVTKIIKHRQIVLDYNDVVGAGYQTVFIKVSNRYFIGFESWVLL